jgi:hypothetical protein
MFLSIFSWSTVYVALSIAAGWSYVNSKERKEGENYIREYRYEGYGGWKYVQSPTHHSFSLNYERAPPKQTSYMSSIYSFVRSKI